MTWRATSNWAVLAAAALFSSCIVIDVGHGASSSSADVTFQWDCGSASACARAGIDEFEIDLFSGSQLVRRTSVSGSAAAATISLEPGAYTYTITGISQGHDLYRASASFIVHAGDNAYAISLSYVGG